MLQMLIRNLTLSPHLLDVGTHRGVRQCSRQRLYILALSLKLPLIALSPPP